MVLKLTRLFRKVRSNSKQNTLPYAYNTIIVNDIFTFSNNEQILLENSNLLHLTQTNISSVLVDKMVVVNPFFEDIDIPDK